MHEIKEIIVKELRQYGDSFWRGTVEDRKKTFLRLHKFLELLSGKRVKLKFSIPAEICRWGNSGKSNYNVFANTITLKGRLSVITFLHEWGHALGMDEKKAQEFAVSIFSTVYPEKFNKLRKIGPMYVR